MTRNEKTSARVAKIAAKWLKLLSRAVYVQIRLVDKNGDVFGPQILGDDTLADFIKPFASALTQTTDKPKRKAKVRR